jgi:hypothetical protein
VAIEKKERQALLDMLWDRAVLLKTPDPSVTNCGAEPLECWEELKASLAAAGFELDLTVIEEGPKA